jgi:hypothetical protein
MPDKPEIEIPVKRTKSPEQALKELQRELNELKLEVQLLLADIREGRLVYVPQEGDQQS